MPRPIALLAAILSATPLLAPLAAQDRSPEVDKIFAALAADAPGCTTALAHNGKIVASRGYGMADLEHGVPITPASVFDAGSIVKQFVAASILLLVEEGRISLTDDIHKYLPEMAPLPHKVTIDHLLSHTSGIRDWTGLLGLAEGEPDILTVIMRQRGLEVVPGDELSYTNSGYELLREIVTRASGMPVGTFMAKRIFEPLGMTSTSYHSDPSDVVKDRAIPYAKTPTGWRQDVNAGVGRGRGGILTTSTDLLRWNDALTSGHFGKFVTAKLQEPAVLNHGRVLTYARGLMIDRYRGTSRVWHSGAAGGYSALLARLPEQGVSLAIMCNADEGAKGAYASRLLDMVLPASVLAVDPEGPVVRPPAPAATALAPDAERKARAGLFFNEKTGQVLRIVTPDNALGIAGVGPLVPLSTDRYRSDRTSLSFLSGSDFSVQFLSVDRFAITTTQGDTLRYRRAVPWTPTVAALQALAGTYESDEIGSGLDVTADKDALVVQVHLNPGKGQRLLPVDKDTFMLSQVVMRFVRNTAGTVIGFDYSNPVVRNIRFTRLSTARR